MVRTRLVCLENTHNRGAGRIQPYQNVVDDLPLGGRARAAAAPGRRPAVQRRGGHGHPGRPMGAALRHGQRLFQQRAGRPGRLGAGRAARADPAGSPASQSCSAAGCGRSAIIAAGALYALQTPHRPAGRRPRQRPDSWPKRCGTRPGCGWTRSRSTPTWSSSRSTRRWARRPSSSQRPAAGGVLVLAYQPLADSGGDAPGRERIAGLPSGRNHPACGPAART